MRVGFTDLSESNPKQASWEVPFYPVVFSLWQPSSPFVYMMLSIAHEQQATSEL